MNNNYYNKLMIMDDQTLDKIKYFEKQVDDFNIEQVTLDSILNYKSFFDNINKYILARCWQSFSIDLEKLNLSGYDIDIDNSLYKEKPKNAILLVKNKVSSMKRIENDNFKLTKLKQLDVELSRLYIKHEDLEEELDESFNHIYNKYDEKFEWLDNNEEFIKISELLEKISKEICDGVKKHINQKKEFYLEYFKQSFKLNSDKELNINSELYASNFIKNYILNNFNDIFNAACLDVMELNKITDTEQIKKIIKIYYDYTKQTTKMMLSLDDIDYRLKMANVK